MFFAADTLIESVSVWRWPADTTDSTPLRLFIMNTTSADLGIEPAGPILLSGPTLVNPFGDGVQPVEYRYVLDPPFALPGKGFFYFCAMEASCLSSIPILADTTDSYPEGGAWVMGPTLGCVSPGGVHGFPPGKLDLVFQIVFCSSPTPTGRDTWGRLKLRYR